MQQLFKTTAVCVLLCSTVFSSIAGENHWYKRHAEGWWWYNEPEVSEEVEEQPPLPPIPEAPKEPPKPKLIEPTPPKSPPAFSSAWLQKMIPEYLSNAVDNPTPENVEAFYILQRLAMDKAERFQKVAEQVRVGNKFIDESERRPISSFGLQTIDREAEVRRVELLKKISKMAGLFFFYREGCQFCEKQAPILKHLEGQGFDVLAIGIGGGQLSTAQFSNQVADSGQAAMLSVESTPTIFLVHPESTTFALVGSSLLSLPEIEERLILISQRNGWISEEEVNNTRPRLQTANGVDLSKKLPEMMKAVQEDPNKISDLVALLEGRDAVAERKQLSEMPDSKTRPLMDEQGFIDPKLLLKMMKDSYSTDATDTRAPRSPDNIPLSFEEGI